MPDVYAWPPVTIGAWENTISRPGTTSYGMAGNLYYSQSQAMRREYAAEVLAAGKTKVGLGYIYMLKRYLDGITPLVRIYTKPPQWFGTARGLHGYRGEIPLDWYAEGRGMTWDGGTTTWVEGTAIDATATTDGDYDAIDCTGLPASKAIAFPGELVRDEAGTIARVVKREVSDSSGNATIRLDGPLATGEVLIGARESVVMEVLEWPRGLMTVDFDARMTFAFREAFSTDFSDAFTDVDPWS